MGWHLVKELLMEYSLRTAGDAPDSGVAASRVNRLPKRGESGFTLVEVLVAIVVLSITGLAAAQFAITAIRTSYAQQQRSTAVSLGDDGMERMRAQIANVDANQYLDELIKGMGETSVTAAQKNLSDVGAITSQLADLSYTSSPDPDKSKYIQPVRATAGKDAKHTEYTVNTVVERCFRASGEISCKTASQLGISRSSATSYTANTSTSATADILDPGKTVSGAFTFGAHTYMPMIAWWWASHGTTTCIRQNLPVHHVGTAGYWRRQQAHHLVRGCNERNNKRKTAYSRRRATYGAR